MVTGGSRGPQASGMELARMETVGRSEESSGGSQEDRRLVTTWEQQLGCQSSMQAEFRLIHQAVLGDRVLQDAAPPSSDHSISSDSLPEVPPYPQFRIPWAQPTADAFVCVSSCLTLRSPMVGLAFFSLPCKKTYKNGPRRLDPCYGSSAVLKILAI